MLITVKILQGQECTIEVSASSSVSAVKQLLAEQLQIPVDQQRLVFRGRTLSDRLSLGDYNIVEGNRLHLFVRKGTENTNALWSEMHKFLLQYFSPEDADKVLEEYKREFANSVASLSLDDIERLAASFLGEASGTAGTSPERAPPPGKGRDPSTPVNVLVVDSNDSL